LIYLLLKLYNHSNSLFGINGNTIEIIDYTNKQNICLFKVTEKYNINRTISSIYITNQYNCFSLPLYIIKKFVS
jgi:hypothetical protein